MSKVEEIMEKGDQYAKRMLIRKQEQNKTIECYSKSLRRRLSIMEAIYKNNTKPSNLYYEGNPFKKEFANTSTTREDEVTRRYGNSDSPVHELSPEAYSVNPQCNAKQWKSRRSCELTAEPLPFASEVNTHCDKSPDNPSDADFNNVEYRLSNQFHRDFRTERQSYGGGRSNADSRERSQPRISIGEYFGALSHKELNSQNFLSKGFGADIESRRKTPDKLFGARVLEVLEPEVMQVERKSLGARTLCQGRASEVTIVPENFIENQRLNNPELESITTSFVSEDIRELEQEIEQLQFQPDVEELAEFESQTRIAETPKRIYPNLTLNKMSNNFTPKKLFHVKEAQKNDPLTVTDVNANMTKILNISSNPTMNTNSEIFTTPMPISDFQLNNLNRTNELNRQNSAMSFFKRNTSFLFNNQHLQKIRYYKPNLESTRKIFNSGGKTTSPMSQECSTISTLTLPNTLSSPDTCELTKKQEQIDAKQKYQQRIDTTIPDEVENFLTLALGDEQFNTTVTFEQPYARDRSNLNVSELISEDLTPIKNRIRSAMRVPMSEPPKHSSTLNRTLTIYKTFTQRIKKKFRGSVKDNLKPMQDNILPNGINPLDDSVKKLLYEMDIQQTYIYQASKALDLCSSMREFAGSRERVESERQLLLANLRKAAAIEEIHKLASRRVDESTCCERAKIILKDLSVQLREEILRRERQTGDVVEWFVLVAREGPLVWASNAVACPESGSRLYFPGEFAIVDLTPDFRLSVMIYSLKLQQIPINHEDKYHIARYDDEYEEHSTTCPSPNKLLRRSDKKKMIVSPRQFDIRFTGIRESSFIVCGSVDLMIHDLNILPPWPLTGVSPKSVLRGTIDLKLSLKLRLLVSHAGFLTHGDEAGGLAVWNRRWCVLEDRNLLFWNYPRDQENKKPLYAIDLANCVSQRIELVNRSLCAKPRTLLIETARRRNEIDRDSIVVECRSTCTIVRNLLSCDSNQDLVQWQSKLNYIVAALREWNMIDKTL